MANSRNFVQCNKAMEAETFQLNGAAIGFCETKGKRPTQEDVMTAFTLDDFDQLSDEGRKAVLHATVEALQNETKCYNQEGACMIGTIAWRQDKTLYAYTAGLGDSLSYMVEIENDKLNKITRLNNELHKPENEKEKERIEKARGYVHAHRLMGQLAVSGAFGDVKLRNFGLRLTADIDIYQTDAETAFLIVACDGLTEGDVRRPENIGLSDQEIGELIAANQNSGLGELSKSLIEAALAPAFNGHQKHASRDNISVAVMKPSEAPTACFVFDGHGGDEVAKLLGARFHVVLREKVQSQLEQEKKTKLFNAVGVTGMSMFGSSSVNLPPLTFPRKQAVMDPAPEQNSLPEVPTYKR